MERSVDSVDVETKRVCAAGRSDTQFRTRPSLIPSGRLEEAGASERLCVVPIRRLNTATPPSLTLACPLSDGLQPTGMSLQKRKQNILVCQVLNGLYVVFYYFLVVAF